MICPFIADIKREVCFLSFDKFDIRKNAKKQLLRLSRKISTYLLSLILIQIIVFSLLIYNQNSCLRNLDCTANLWLCGARFDAGYFAPSQNFDTNTNVKFTPSLSAFDTSRLLCCKLSTLRISMLLIRFKPLRLFGQDRAS